MPGLENIRYGAHALPAYLWEFSAKQVRHAQKEQDARVAKTQKLLEKQQSKVPAIVEVLGHQPGRKYNKYHVRRYVNHAS